MNPSQMLSQMCHEVLSNVDIKAISKNRGLAAKEVTSRALFENFFLSDIGLAAVFNTLTPEEVALIHLLKSTGEAVDIAFFARVYADEKQAYFYGSFNQRYKDVFQKVKQALIRKGVLILAEVPVVNSKSKMERWRFWFPQEFEPFLPPLITSAETFDDEGDIRSDILKQKIRTLTEGEETSLLPPAARQAYQLRLVDGVLQIGDKPFREQYLLAWQRDCWGSAIPAPKADEGNHWMARRSNKENVLPVIEAVTYVFNQLAENEWLRPQQLAVPLKIFTNEIFDAQEVCLIGWYWGCLARQKKDRKVYYRLAAEKHNPDPALYLQPDTANSLRLDLDKVPYAALEQLARIAKLQIPKNGRNTLGVRPDLVRLGRALAIVRNDPLIQWLRENVPTFRQALKTVEARWGKHIIHQNLLIAQVNDLGLKVQLERTFSDPQKVIFLPNGYLAFPAELLPQIERIITKSGHVIKRVQEND